MFKGRLSGAFAAVSLMMLRAVITAVCLVAMSLISVNAAAGPIDFLKRVGHSIAKANRQTRRPHRAPQRTVNQTTAAQQTKQLVSKGDERDDSAATKGAQPGAQRPATSPKPVAAAAQNSAGRADQPAKPALGDLPFGVPVPNRPGFVVSPYSLDGGYVDVNGYASGSPVKDPYTGKMFRVP